MCPPILRYKTKGLGPYRALQRKHPSRKFNGGKLSNPQAEILGLCQPSETTAIYDLCVLAWFWAAEPINIEMRVQGVTIVFGLTHLGWLLFLKNPV